LISLFSGPNCPQTRDSAAKISKIFPGVIPPNPVSGRGRRRARGRKLPRCWDQGLGNRSPNQNLPLHPCSCSLCPSSASCLKIQDSTIKDDIAPVHLSITGQWTMTDSFGRQRIDNRNIIALSTQKHTSFPALALQPCFYICCSFFEAITLCMA